MKDLRDPPQKTPADGLKPAVDWDGWFGVPGDVDDFIFFGEPENPASER